MSDRITWETCPNCGDLAAVGWERVAWSDGDQAGELVVEFDCPNGCSVLVEPLERTYRRWLSFHL